MNALISPMVPSYKSVRVLAEYYELLTEIHLNMHKDIKENKYKRYYLSKFIFCLIFDY